MDPATPNAPFKWESASGLEHSCFSCAMKMSNQKAKLSCYGVHSIPCHRYHQTMHAIGTSHNCFSCIQSDELHDNRHRKIAELVAEYKAAVGEEGGHASPNPRNGLEELPINIHRLRVQPVRPQYDPDGNDDVDENDENDDAETTTDTTTSDSMATPGKPTKAEKRALKRAAKAVKSQNKAFKNQAKHTISVKTQDVELVNTVLHGDAASTGDTHPLASDKTIEEVIQRNLGFASSIEEHKRQLMSSIGLRRRDEREKRNATPSARDNKKRRFSAVSQSSHTEEDEEDEETENLLTAVLTKLGIEREHIKSGGTGGRGNANLKKNVGRHPITGGLSACNNHSANTAHRLSIVGNLKRLVKDDLEKFDNDQRETCVRAGGFWRYVGKPVFDRMTVIAGQLDWKTGAKLKERNVDE